MSGAAHLLVFAALLLVRASAPTTEPQETPVEIVQEAPAAKAAPPPAKPAQEARDAPKAPARDAPKEQARSPEPPPPAPTAEEVAGLQALRDELASLKAEQADLHAQAEADAKGQEPNAGREQSKAQGAAVTRQQAADRTKTLGLLPESFSAVAMPALAPNGDDPVTYDQAIYNLVGRAKKSNQAYLPGVAHVVFEVDAKGGLTRVVVDRSSGNTAVDEEAVALIRRAAPFPPPPDGAPHSFPAYMSFVADH